MFFWQNREVRYLEVFLTKADLSIRPARMWNRWGRCQAFWGFLTEARSQTFRCFSDKSTKSDIWRFFWQKLTYRFGRSGCEIAGSLPDFSSFFWQRCEVRFSDVFLTKARSQIFRGFSDTREDIGPGLSALEIVGRPSGFSRFFWRWSKSEIRWFFWQNCKVRYSEVFPTVQRIWIFPLFRKRSFANQSIWHYR